MERKLVTEMEHGTDRGCRPTGLFPQSASKHHGGIQASKLAEGCGWTEQLPLAVQEISTRVREGS